MKNPILLDLPEEFSSENLVIRVARPGDGPMFNRAVAESSEHLSPWVAWANGSPTVDDSEAICRRA